MGNGVHLSRPQCVNSLQRSLRVTSPVPLPEGRYPQTPDIHHTPRSHGTTLSRSGIMKRTEKKVMFGRILHLPGCFS